MKCLMAIERYFAEDIFEDLLIGMCYFYNQTRKNCKMKNIKLLSVCQGTSQHPVTVLFLFHYILT